METPSSTIKECKKKKSSALFDITNGSPIVGLAIGILKTPSSAVSRSTQRRKCCTPGSGEALLRGQVKNLLQMVEEEEEAEKIISLGKRRSNFFHVVAPTPANMDLSNNELLLPPVEDKFIISQILNKNVHEGEKSVECETTSVTRSLLLDFCDKSEEEEIDELCEAIGNINVNGGQKFGTKFCV